MKNLLYDTDRLMSRTWLQLHQDFRTSLGPRFCPDALDVFLRGGIKELRDYVWPSRMYRDVYWHKCQYQLENFFKRYRFEQDRFTDEQLETAAHESFVRTQERVSKPLNVTYRISLVLKEAKSIATRILGQFDKSELLSMGRFATEACVGHPRRNSYLDSKLTGEITGSKEHLLFLWDVCDGDYVLAEALKGKCRVVDNLELTFVPKSFKSLRAIMPDTLAGSLYSSALGRLFALKLREHGLDIRRLQKRHGELARIGSITGNLVTADLSSASDSITCDLIRSILPETWAEAVFYGRIDQARCGDQVIPLASVCTMGLGHTFPLQTLIFYALVRAIGNLLGKPNCVVSVYGDDLIYDIMLHRYVEQVFPDLHLILNKEKTYATRAEPFRESCGSDYYCGIDVRPSAIEARGGRLDRRLYVEFIYGLINSLLNRWEPEEIDSTLKLLIDTVFLVDEEVFVIPQDYPDHSGVKLRGYEKFFGLKENVRNANGTLVFDCYTTHPKDRQIKDELPFYWDALRCANHQERGIESIPIFDTTVKSLRSNGYEKPTERIRVKTVKRRDAIKRVKFNVCIAVVSRKDQIVHSRTTANKLRKMKAPKWIWPDYKPPYVVQGKPWATVWDPRWVPRRVSKEPV